MSRDAWDDSAQLPIQIGKARVVDIFLSDSDRELLERVEEKVDELLKRPHFVACPKCYGSGRDYPLYPLQVCSQCGGKGFQLSSITIGGNK